MPDLALSSQLDVVVLVVVLARVLVVVVVVLVMVRSSGSDIQWSEWD